MIDLSRKFLKGWNYSCFCDLYHAGLNCHTTDEISLKDEMILSEFEVSCFS